MDDEWSVTVMPGHPGWIDVPVGLTGGHLDAWVDDAMGRLRQEWASQWHDESAAEVRQLLVSAAVARAPAAVLDLLYWPFPRPFVVRMSVLLGRSTPLSAWRDAGFEVDAFDSAKIGPGVRCIAMGETRDEARHPLITVHFVFDDGERTLQLTVEPVLLELYAQVWPALLSVVCSVEVDREDGRPFVPRPVSGYTLSDDDRFARTNGA